MTMRAIAAAAALGLWAVAAAAQTSGQSGGPPRPPVTSAPIPLNPSSPTDDARAKEELDYQRERHRLDLERRRLENQQFEDAREGRSLLGAPTFVAPGTAPYVAPQYPAGAPAYTQPSYQTPPREGALGYRAGCRQYAPAYDEAGRFLANVCVR
jgi:hypothetical protein